MLFLFIVQHNVLTWGLAGSTGYSVILIVSLDRDLGRAAYLAAAPCRRTSHPVATQSGCHQNPSYSRSSGSGGWDQSLWRHLAARTLGGPSTKIRRGVPLVDIVMIVGLRPLCGLQHGALRNLALGYIAPDRNQQLAGERNDRDPADPPAFIADAGVEPTTQGARWLMSLP
jgi:hypothetical protein